MLLPDILLDPLLTRMRAIEESRAPDFTIGRPGDPYMQRWWTIPRNRFANAYLHRIVRSDDDRALHDHPWPSLSIMLEGSLQEIWADHAPDGAVIHRARWIVPGAVVWRGPCFAHRLVADPVRPALTLFLTGPRLRTWGFHCPQGWRPWNEFVHPSDPGQPGRGCE